MRRTSIGIRAVSAAAITWIGAAGVAAAGAGGVDEFELPLETVVEPGVPGPGAGEIEAPGNQDIYAVTVQAGQRLFFDNLGFSNSGLGWRVFDSAGEQVFSASIFSDRGPFDVLDDGSWTIIVDDFGDDTGTYSFIVWDAMIDGPFAIDTELIVEPRVPGAGAGAIEEPGDEDHYTLDVVAGQRLFFDNLAFSNSGLRWRVFDSADEQVFSASIFSDRGPFDVLDDGSWTVIVDSAGDATGTYSFTAWDIRVDGPFAIDVESVVEPGVPGAGAGEIEEPGDEDRYTLDVRAGQRLFFDNLAFSSSGLRWRVFDSADEQVFSASIFSDRGPFDVASSGTWTVIVDAAGDAAGTYSFTVWDTRVDGPFAIDVESVVEPGVPGAGAGEIEEPGDEDRYTLDVRAGQRLFFDNLAFSSSGLRWRAVDAEGQQVFSASIFSDRGPFEVETSGTWTIIVDDAGDDAGTYSFTVWDTRNDGPFAIDLESVVEPGVPGPGAGEIEEPGDTDRYVFDVVAGQVLYFNNLDFSDSGLRWRVIDAEGQQVFTASIFSNRGPFEVAASGTWELIVDDAGDGAGTYAFVIWDTESDTFPIEINQIVDVDVPGPGAGWIEQPGNIDRYLIEGFAGDVWCAVNLAFETPQLRWRLLDPEGGELFSSAIFSDQSSLPLELDGTYVLEVFGSDDAVGTYSFVVNRTTRADVNGDCVVGFDDLLAVLAAWGPCEDPSGCLEDVDEDELIGFGDILEILANWTQ